MPEKEDAEFQIELLKIQIRSEMATGFFTASIAIGLSALLSLGINLTFTSQYNPYALVSQTVVVAAFVIIIFGYWKIAVRKINERVEKLRKKPVPSTPLTPSININISVEAKDHEAIKDLENFLRELRQQSPPNKPMNEQECSSTER
jgi:hypothetical protein